MTSLACPHACAQERKHLVTLEKRLQKGVISQVKRCSEQLCRQLRVEEFKDFLSEQSEPPPELKAALNASTREVEAAREAIRSLDPDDLEELRLMQDLPSDEIRESVEAVAVILGFRADFISVQTRLMPKENAFRERLLGFDKAHTPTSARARLGKFLSTRTSEPLAVALREWVQAHVNYEGASAEIELLREQTLCSAPMQAACECLCDLHGMHNIEDDLRGALLMAQKFRGDK